MNLELLQTVDQSYPEHNDGILDSGSEALTCAFNRRGTLLAVGCNDGRIAIWDFMTRGIARMCNSHIHPITSLSWNRSSRKLLSSSTDWNVLLWDIASGEIDLRFRFPSPVLKAQFHPRNTNIFLVCPMKNVPVLVKREGEEYKHVPLPTDGEPELNIVASFDRRGERIVTGSSKGKVSMWPRNGTSVDLVSFSGLNVASEWDKCPSMVLVIDTDTLQVLKSYKLTGTTAVKSIEFARRGSNFLVNSSDRVIRVYDIEEIMRSGDGEVEALQRLQDLVNRTQWKKCTFSGDGEFIVAGSHRQHALYIWDKGTGSLAKMLTGQKGETLLDIVWHPVRPIILSISTGVVNVWSQAQVELWSAYAPNFKELDENEEFEEKEDEFDIEDEDRLREGEGEEGGEDENMINVLGVQPIPAFCSSDEDMEDSLDWLPMAPEIEDPEEPGWGQLEPSLNELPPADSSGTGGKKRPANDENVDPSMQPPVPKQPRTIEIDLPNHYDAMEANQKEVKVKSQRSGKRGRPKKGQRTEREALPPANGRDTLAGGDQDTSATNVQEASSHGTSVNGEPTSANRKDSSASGADTISVQEEGGTVAVPSEEGDSSGPARHLDSGSGHREADRRTELESVDRESGDKQYPREEETEVGNVGEEVSELREGTEEQPEPSAVGSPEPSVVGPPEPLVVGSPEPSVVGPPEPLVVGSPEPSVVGPPEPLVVGSPEPSVVGPPEPLVVGSPEPSVVGPPEPSVVGPPESLVVGPPEPSAVGPPPLPQDKEDSGCPGAPD